MKRKSKYLKLFTITVSVLLLAGLFSTAGTVFAEEGEDSGDGNQVPPGQMVRGGLTGPVVDVGDGYVVVETKFGPVKVYTDEEVDESMIGRRVAVKLEKTEGGASGYAGNATGKASGDTGNGSAFREATALQFRLIPEKGTKKHQWGILESTEEGCFFIDEDGNSIPAECSGTDEDVIGLVDDSGNGTGMSGNTTPLLLKTQKASKIRLRIQSRLQQAEGEGDAKAIQRLQKQLENYEAREVKRLEIRAIRAEKVQVKAQKKIDKAEKNTGNQDN